MSLGHCSCPACGTTLRVRDRSFVGRTIECPDCQAQLLIKLDDDRNPVAERPPQETTRPPKPPKAAVARIRSAWTEQLSGYLYSPLVLAWALAIGVTAFLAILMLRPAVRLRIPSSDPSQSAAVAESADGSARTDPNRQADGVVEPQETPSPEVIPQTGAPRLVTTENANPEATPNQSPTPGVPIVVKAETTEPSAVTASPNPDPGPKPVAPPPVKIDVERHLTQRLGGFVTNTPRSRQVIIEQLEEMLGAPIRYDREELGEKNLAQTVSMNLEATTLGGVLKSFVETAGWESVIENDGIRLKPRQVAGTTP